MINFDNNHVLADKIVEYLKKRILLNQRIIELKYSEDQIMSYDLFTIKYNRLKSSIESIKDVNDPVRKELVILINELKDDYANKVLLSQKEIEDFMSLIRSSIIKFGVDNLEITNETMFIRNILKKVLISQEEKMGLKYEYDALYEKINDFYSFFSINDNIGFCKKLCGEMGIDRNSNDFIINSFDGQPLLRVNPNGHIILNRVSQDEDILISSDIYIGVLHKNNTDIATFFLEKDVNGKKQMKAIYYDDKLYSFEDSGLDNFIKYAKPMNQIFETKGLGFMTEFVYTNDTFKDTIKAFNKSKNMTEEEKNNLDKVVETVVEWWSGVIEFSKNNIDDNSLIGVVSSKLSMIINKYKKTKNKLEIENFKTNLANIIRKQLLISPKFILSADGKILMRAAKKARLDITFPSETMMWVAQNNVSVKANYSDDVFVLYDTDDKKYVK